MFDIKKSSLFSEGHVRSSRPPRTMTRLQWIYKTMLEDFFDKYFANTIYIRFNSDRIAVKSMATGKTCEDKPLVAIGRKGNKKCVVGAGRDAELQPKPDTTIHNGFSHPRVCIGDFDLAEATIKHFVTRVVGKMLFIRPVIIMHPLRTFDGGLSQIEVRAIRELGYSAGGRKVFIWIGRELKDIELATLTFPESEGEIL